GVLQVRFQDTVELDALPAGEAQGAVAVSVGQLVQGEILLRRHAAARNLAAHHEHVVLAKPLAAAGLAGVAVLLLIGAVGLQGLVGLLAERIAVFPQFFGDRAAQGTTVLLDPFHGRTARFLDRPFGGPVRALMRFARHTLTPGVESSLSRSIYLY